MWKKIALSENRAKQKESPRRIPKRPDDHNICECYFFFGQTLIPWNLGGFNYKTCDSVFFGVIPLGHTGLFLVQEYCFSKITISIVKASGKLLVEYQISCNI